eukprot:sb/3466486/
MSLWWPPFVIFGTWQVLPAIIFSLAPGYLFLHSPFQVPTCTFLHTLTSETDIESIQHTDGTWDYDHMDVTADAEEDDDQRPKLEKQTTEDREVENFTHLQTNLIPPDVTSDNGSESGDSSVKTEEPVNRFRSLSSDVDKDSKPPEKPISVPVKLLENPVEYQTSDIDTEGDEKQEDKKVLSNTFIKKPSPPKKTTKDLWRKAGIGIKARLPFAKGAGIMGVIKKAEAEGQLKPKLFNQNIAKAIENLSMTKEIEKEQAGKVKEDQPFLVEEKDAKTVTNPQKPSVKEDKPEKGKKTPTTKIPRNRSNSLSGAKPVTPTVARRQSLAGKFESDNQSLF